jgi:hypothetical protein
MKMLTYIFEVNIMMMGIDEASELLFIGGIILMISAFVAMYMSIHIENVKIRKRQEMQDKCNHEWYWETHAYPNGEVDMEERCKKCGKYRYE